MTFSEMHTVGGYNNAEVASALQKSIRRGLEEDALFWATELDLSNFGEYVWKRLRIIASEDIGQAEPHAVVRLRALYDNWRDQRKKDDSTHAPERLFLVDAVMTLCRARKSREVDCALIVYYEGQRPTREVPDFALDRHTRRGKGKRRAWAHFWEEGARTDDPAAIPPSYLARALDIRRDEQTELSL